MASSSSNTKGVRRRLPRARMTGLTWSVRSAGRCALSCSRAARSSGVGCGGCGAVRVGPLGGRRDVDVDVDVDEGVDEEVEGDAAAAGTA